MISSVSVGSGSTFILLTAVKWQGTDEGRELSRLFYTSAVDS